MKKIFKGIEIAGRGLFQLSFRLLKAPLKFIRVFYYQNLYRRNAKRGFSIEEAKPFLYSGKSINAVLRSGKEVKESLGSLRKLKLRPHPDRLKNWDCYRALSYILNNGNAESKVLDVGSGYYGVILPWLERCGFSNLYGCDLVFNRDFRRGRIKFVKGDLTKTTFPDGFFDFVTSISVIEHGVDADAYFQEMGRILKPGGYLLTSTDYWNSKIDTRGLHPYGKDFGQAKIFSKSDIRNQIKKSKEYGFKLSQPIDFTHKDRVVYWKDIDRSFTFLFFVLQKI